MRHQVEGDHPFTPYPAVIYVGIYTRTRFRSVLNRTLFNRDKVRQQRFGSKLQLELFPKGGEPLKRLSRYFLPLEVCFWAEVLVNQKCQSVIHYLCELDRKTIGFW